MQLYIGNLACSITSVDLLKFFTNKGYKLKSAEVELDQFSESKEYGFLEFFSAKEADRCQKEMNNTLIHGQQVVLDKDKNKILQI